MIRKLPVDDLAKLLVKGDDILIPLNRLVKHISVQYGKSPRMDFGSLGKAIDSIIRLNAIIGRIDASDSILDTLTGQIKTLRICIDRNIITHIHKDDHFAYFIWCVGRAVRRRQITHRKNGQKTYSWFSLSETINHLASDMSPGRRCYFRKQVLKAVQNKTFFRGYSNDMVFFRGIRKWKEDIGFDVMSGRIFTAPASFQEFRKQIVTVVAQATYLVNNESEKNELVKPVVYNQEKEECLYGRSLKTISETTGYSEKTVIDYLRNKPRTSRFSIFSSAKTFSTAEKIIRHASDDISGLFVKKSDGLYVIMQRHSNLYHDTAIKRVLYRDNQDKQIGVRKTRKDKQWYRSFYSKWISDEMLPEVKKGGKTENDDLCFSSTKLALYIPTFINDNSYHYYIYNNKEEKAFNL
jgi:hypothetical protein